MHDIRDGRAVYDIIAQCSDFKNPVGRHAVNQRLSTHIPDTSSKSDCICTSISCSNLVLDLVQVILLPWGMGASYGYSKLCYVQINFVPLVHVT